MPKPLTICERSVNISGTREIQAIPEKHSSRLILENKTNEA